MSETNDAITVFHTPLGWVAMLGSGRVLRNLTFGHPSRKAAAGALMADLARNARIASWNRSLVRRIEAYAAGRRDDFRDVEVDPGSQTDFQRRAIASCRKIPFGQTTTYGRLAAEAGFPGAARAVGNCMAANRIPLVVPCHRVVTASGGLGGYSAAGGVELKRRLLELEAGRTPCKCR